MKDKDLSNYIKKLNSIYKLIDDLPTLSYENKYWILYRLNNRITFIKEELGIKPKKIKNSSIFRIDYKFIK